MIFELQNYFAFFDSNRQVSIFVLNVKSEQTEQNVIDTETEGKVAGGLFSKNGLIDYLKKSTSEEIRKNATIYKICVIFLTLEKTPSYTEG